jgi:superoxide dismutase, Fe-Mn family
MHELPKLPYAYDALEPYIDAKTMELHHTKHHQTYVTKLNEALAAHPELAEKPLETLLMDIGSVPEDIRKAVRNHGGGHFNHSFFWRSLAPGKGGEPAGDLAAEIGSAFGSFAAFKEQFTKAAGALFGSGWCWLVLKDGKLSIESLPLQDAPIMTGLAPVLGLDVWEHAYYLKYQNRRPEYVEAWWNVVNWDEAAANLAAAAKKQ